MTEQQQRIAIAESLGWMKTKTHGLTMTAWRDPNGNFADMPDYLNDLNVCHEFEKVFYDKESELMCLYSRVLCSICEYPIHATAAQRCEAYLRTKGLWQAEGV